MRKRDNLGRKRVDRRRLESELTLELRPSGSQDGGRGGVAVDHDAAWVAGVRERLAAWYAEAGRDLPWRADRDPYRILVSEMMLVQTTVAAVIPYFERFIGRYPDVAAAGRRGSRRGVEGMGGSGLLPEGPAASCGGASDRLQARRNDSPRIPRRSGHSRASAATSPAPSSRLPSISPSRSSRQTVSAFWRGSWPLRQNLKMAPARERLWQAAERLVPAANAGAFNQALMELGALVCTPREPACLLLPGCELLRGQAAGPSGSIAGNHAETTSRGRSTEAAAVVGRRGQVLIVQRGLGGLWEQFWEFPTIHLEGVDPAGRSLGPGGRPGRGRQAADRDHRSRSGRRSRPSSTASPIIASS